MNVKVAVGMAVVLGGSLPIAALGAPASVAAKGKFTVYTAPTTGNQAASMADIANAQAMPLPTVALPPVGPMDGDIAPQGAAKPGYAPGAAGNGKTSPVNLPAEGASSGSELLSEIGGGITPQEYGTANLPYTTMRVDLAANNESKTYPYRAAGKLYFKDGAGSYVCSASLIKRGLVVTAAHCVASFGQKRFYTGWQFVPARYDNLAPYGIWNAESAVVPTAYYNGTDSCAQRGVVCGNDIAVIRLAPQAGAFPGTQTGWFGYGWDGFGFTANNLALINQLGYPVTHDSGLRMQRTDAQGYVSGSYSNNTVWGSRQTGGSSGGPELVNLGVSPVLATPLGAEATANVVVGVTSWGYVAAGVKQQGASPFTSTNIVALVSTACTGKAACQ